MADAITWGVVALLFSGYGLVVLVRRARLRATATALQATYVGGSLSRPGRIEGTRFTIRVVHVRRSFRTHVDVPTSHAPGTYFLDAGFFGTPHDWSRARVPGRRTERVFFWSLSLPGYAFPSQEQRNVLSNWLNRGPSDRRLQPEALEAARISSIAIDDTGVSTSFEGIVTNPARLRRAIDLLQRLAADVTA